MAILSSVQHDASPETHERRTSRRRPLCDIPVIAEVKFQTKQVQVVNISAGGLLIHVSLRLLPGTRTQLEIVRAADGSLNVPGRIVRSEVSGISRGALQYWVAIAFDRPLDFVDLNATDDTITASASDPSEAQASPFFSTEESLGQYLEVNAW
jgi:hypothetical protein